MDVTAGNFEACLDALQMALDDCDFYAIDLEFTGLAAESWRRPAQLDTLETRYQKVRHSAQRFTPLQLGVCLFKCVRGESDADDAGRYVARPFNINVFGRARKGVPFMCSAESINFLAQQGFDFSKAFREGVPYMQHAQYADAVARLQGKIDAVESGAAAEAERHKNKIKIKDARDQEFVDGVLASIREAKASWEPAKQEPAAAEAPEPPSLLLPSANGFLRRLLYQEVGAAFPDVELSKFEQDNTQSSRGRAQLRATWVPDVAARARRKREHELEQLAAQREKLDAKLGATRIVDALRASRKPLIGHNCLLDVAHVMEAFVQPLPSTVRGFADAVHEHFPVVIDTKQLAAATGHSAAISSAGIDLRVVGTALGDLYAGVCGELTCPSIGLATEPRFNRYEAVIGATAGQAKCDDSSAASKYAHEAGFDAFMTGTVLVRWMHALRHKLGADGVQPLAAAPATATHDAGDTDDGDSTGASWIGHVVNHLFLMRTRTTLRMPWHPTVIGEDRAHVLYLGGLPAESQTDAILAELRCYWRVGARAAGRTANGGTDAGASAAAPAAVVSGTSRRLEGVRLDWLCSTCLLATFGNAGDARQCHIGHGTMKGGACEVQGSAGKLAHDIELQPFAFFARRCAEATSPWQQQGGDVASSATTTAAAMEGSASTGETPRAAKRARTDSS